MVDDAVHSRTKDISEGSSSKVPEPSVNKRAPRLGGHLEGETEGPGPEALQRDENAPSGSLGVINVDDLPPGPEFFEGQFRDARNMRTPDVGTSHEGHDIFRECLARIEDAVMLHKEAFSTSRVELSRREAELKKISKERDSLKTLYVKKEEEISDLRAELEKARQKQTDLIEKAQQKGELVEQLREELRMKEAETLGWRQGMDCLASEKDTLREQLALIECQFQSVKEEILARAKSEAKAFISSYRADAEAANTRAKDIFVVAEVKLSCALDHARRQSRRETLEEVLARGFDLSADIEKEEDSPSGSESGGDEDEVPEDEAPEDAAPGDATAEDVVE
ncbi:uncharacterized protein [Nicotiana sylvestris]|uniref:uncharacterized protein n=1 Tax=Nicotiana sylvestris TaxID=4096 RepID=UPI00388C8D86